MTNCSFSMIPADDDGCDLDSINLELKSEPLAVEDNSSISDRAHNDSQVSKEQSHDNVPASAVENKTCCDPIPSVSSSGAPSTYGVNYQVGTEGCSRSEEMLPENGNCAIPGDGGESSQNGDYGEESLESETGLGENTRVLGEEAIVEDPNGDEASGGRKKKIGKSNWKWNQVLRLKEKGDEYLGRSKKNDMILARSLGRRCCCIKGGYQCMKFGYDEREKIFKNVWSLSWGQKRTYVTSLIEKEDVARRTASHSSESGADVFRKQNTFSYFLKAASGQREKRFAETFFCRPLVYADGV